MDDKRLKQLIQSADVVPAIGESALLLAARLPALHRRRRRRNIAAAAAIAVVFGCVIWRLAPRSVPEIVRVPTQAPINVAAIQAEIRQTDAEIARREKVVAALLAAERERRLERQLSELNARTAVLPVRDEQVARAAASYLVLGDQQREIGLPLASAKEYTHVVELFPGTVWAKQARARLASLPH